jgi:site-specific DNA recombinase
MRRSGKMSVIVASSSNREAEADAVLVKAMARGFTWFEQLSSGNGDTIESIARRERVTGRYVSRMIELAFLSARIVEEVLSGKRGMGVSTEGLVRDDLPLAWRQQSVVVSGHA